MTYLTHTKIYKIVFISRISNETTASYDTLKYRDSLTWFGVSVAHDRVGESKPIGHVANYDTITHGVARQAPLNVRKW